MNNKVAVISLGCAKNQVDAEMLLYTLKERGFKLVDEAEKADAVIVNTCGFIDSSKQESIDEIIELGSLKREGKIKAISGEETIELFPDKLLLPLEGGRVQSTPFYTAYLKIAEGCDNKCTFCAIPMIRGKFRSRNIESLIDEAKTLAANGVRELNVIAQDTTRYGEDIYGKPSLDKLLTELCKIDGLHWIRVLYCYPDSITDSLIDVMAKEDKIVKYIDLPLQHCNSEILHKMHRRGDRESLTALLRKIKEKMPNVIFRSTFITGFPGETEEQFEELAEFAKEINFQRLGCFAYSQEEGTPAAKMPGQLDEETKQRRADIIMEHQQSVMADYCESLIDTEVEVLVEGFDRIAECWYGRSYADAPEVDGCVFFTAEEKPAVGDFIKVKITDYMGVDPFGEKV